jgi:hypothetical protein
MSRVLNVVIEKRLDEGIYQFLACIGFWNAEGNHVYECNRAGTMGSKFTQERARKESYQEFVFNSLMADYNTFTSSGLEKYEGYTAARAGSHIWVAYKQERTLLIHF